MAFNAYIAGAQGGTTGVDYSFVFSTTGQAAKSWLIDWNDGTTTPLTAGDPVVGFTTPQTVQHHYDFTGPYAITATATSTTNVTANAVFQENSSFGNTSSTGKEVTGLSDAASVGTNIATVVDENNNTYVLSIDGKRMAVTRFKTNGTIDTTTGWTTTGTYILPYFTNVNNQDTPRAMAIDTYNHYLFVAGGSGGKWAVARLNYNDIRNNALGWTASVLTGTANALSVDTTDQHGSDPKLGVAGTNTSNQIEMGVLHEKDGFNYNGGTFDTSWGGGTGHAAAANSIYGVPSPYVVTASASSILEGDDAPFSGGVDEEWFVSGTVGYCCGSCTPSTGSDMVIVDFLSSGQTDTTFGNGNGAALYNSCCASCVVSSGSDSNYAMVGYQVGGTPYLTLVGTSGSSVLTERFTADGAKDTAGYGVLSGGTRPGFAWGPAGAAYAAVLDPATNKVVASGSGGSSDFMAMRFNDDGSMDTSFGSGGSIKIDFGSTSGVTTDGARAVSVRVIDNVVDIVVGGYTFDSATSKYKIALVDLLDDHSFHVV
jgi:hypothetical protein